MRSLLISLLATTLLSSCASMKPADFADDRTPLKPQEFFIGHTKSTGVVESRGGKPTARITTETMGVLKDGILTIEQDLYTEGSKPNHRTWKMRQIDEHHVEATATDVVGTARGVLYGNYFTWSFPLKLPDGKIVKRVRMSQNMYLMPDGKTMIIRSIIRKYGIIVAEITEQFKKD